MMVTKTVILQVLSASFNGGKKEASVSGCVFTYGYYYIAGMACTMYLAFIDISFVERVISHGMIVTLITEMFLIVVFSILISLSVALVRPIIRRLKESVGEKWNNLPEG